MSVQFRPYNFVRAEMSFQLQNHDAHICEPLHLTKVSYARYAFVKLCEAVHIFIIDRYRSFIEAIIASLRNIVSFLFAAIMTLLIGSFVVRSIKCVR